MSALIIQESPGFIRGECQYGKLKHADHYRDTSSWIERMGDIYKCVNEECEMYQEYFYTDKYGELYEGYP
jgi:hypothetical protein